MRLSELLDISVSTLVTRYVLSTVGPSDEVSQVDVIVHELDNIRRVGRQGVDCRTVDIRCCRDNLTGDRVS